LPRAALALALCVLGCGDAGGGETSTTGGVGSTSSTSSTGSGSSGEASSGPTSGATTGGPSPGSTGEGGTTGAHDDTTGGTGADACADSVLTWENFGEPFMLSWCTGCHHSELPSAERACAPCFANFDEHAGVHPLAAYIELRVLDWAEHEGTQPMPPAAIIPDDERALLREYLECGAPGPGIGKTSPSCPDPDTVVPDCP
jgi:hypothetical protein